MLRTVLYVCKRWTLRLDAIKFAMQTELNTQMGTEYIMPCYTVGHITVNNPEGYQEYARQVPATIAAHGGEYLVRGGTATDIEGTMPHDRHVVLRFASREVAEAWYTSPEYQAILPIRLANSTGVMTIVDGYEP